MSASNDYKGNQQTLQRLPMKTIFKAEGECLEIDMPIIPEMILVESTIVTKSSYAASNIEEGCCTLDLSATPDKTRINQNFVKCATSIVQHNTQNVSKRCQPILQPTQLIVNKIHSSENTKSTDSNSGENLLNNHVKKPTKAIPSKSKSVVSMSKISDPISINKVDASTSTESPNPMRDRSIQTDVSAEKVSIGIQCNIADGFPEDEEVIISETLDICEETKEEFIKFVEENVHIYTESILECNLCGEIKESRMKMEEHMALHWGPTALCSTCGLYFEHEKFLRKHSCSTKSRTLKQLKNLLKNPYSSQFYTPSMEIKISKRSQKYPKFILNSVIRKTNVLLKKCKKSKLFPSFYCEICLANCRNSLHSKNHQRKCLKEQKNRLRNIRSKLIRKQIIKLKYDSPEPLLE